MLKGHIKQRPRQSLSGTSAHVGTVREPDGLSAFGGVLFSWSNSLSACGGPFSMPEQPW